MLTKGKTYYFATPLTSVRTIDKNRMYEESAANLIKKMYPDIKLVRPLDIIPADTDENIALELCHDLLELCDGIIFNYDLERSKGCMYEFIWSVQNDLEIHFLSSLIGDTNFCFKDYSMWVGK